MFEGSSTGTKTTYSQIKPTEFLLINAQTDLLFIQATGILPTYYVF